MALDMNILVDITVTSLVQHLQGDANLTSLLNLYIHPTLDFTWEISETSVTFLTYKYMSPSMTVV